MAPPEHPAFTHRQNRDGTIDSICLACWYTICTSMQESDLELAEKNHVCDPVVLEHWKRLATQQTVTGAQQP